MSQPIGEKLQVHTRRTVLLTSLAACASSLVSPVAASRDLMLSIGGQNFHVETLGASGPAVVFVAGLGNASTTWNSVAGPIASFARVVLYDRPGLGKSLPLVDTTSPVTADRVAAHLRTLLAAAGVPPSYILVGHSLGGLYVQMFAKRYPREVLGIVLLDSSSTDAPDELKTRARLEPGTAAYLEQEGIPQSNRQVVDAGPFPDVPLTVIAATDHGPHFKEWEPMLMRLQRGLAALSPRSTFIVAEGSGHDVQIDRPDIVVEAVRRLAETAANR
jgi:pimeloyl-ACP methyl ester carboxylesterase